jgi:hypothetical protein
MWEEALPLAFAAAIYPPALLALVVLLRKPPVAARGLGFLGGAFAVTYIAGAAILAIFGAAGIQERAHREVSDWVDITAGVALLAVAWLVNRGGSGDRPREKKDKEPGGWGPAFALGFVMYTPSLLWASAVKQVAAADLSTGGDAAVLALLALVVVSFTAIPVAAALRWPEATGRQLERVNGLLTRHGRRIVVVVLGAAGVALILKGALG